MNSNVLQQLIISILVLSAAFSIHNTCSQPSWFDKNEALAEYKHLRHKTDTNQSMHMIRDKYNISRNQDRPEINEDVRIKQDITGNYERQSNTKMTSVFTNSLDNNTKEILEWLKIAFDRNKPDKNDGRDYTELHYGDCYAYINASTLEALHALEFDNRLHFMFDEKFNKSCADPCANFTQPIKFNSQPIFQQACGSSMVIIMNANRKYENMCLPRLHVTVNKPFFIHHKLYWCISMDNSHQISTINKRNVHKHDIDDDNKQQGKLVLPHRRTHSKIIYQYQLFDS
jgi:hypothetical protein